MKPAKINKNISAPVYWAEMPWGEHYHAALEYQLKPWYTKMYGFYLIKIGNLSAEINTEDCAIIHQINVSLAGQPVNVKADPLYLPFAEKSVDACLLAQTLPWCYNPHLLLREANRILIDNGWLILSGFNPISLIGLLKLVPMLSRRPPYNGRMFTIKRQVDWLFLLNFEVLYYRGFQVLPWLRQGNKLLNTFLPALGCMQLIVARKRTIPLMINPTKDYKVNVQFFPAATTLQ